MKLMSLILPVVCLASSSELWSSGSYTPRPPQPPARVTEDSGKYELGKAIFLGSALLLIPSGAEKTVQRVRLADLQEKLPARVRKNVHLAGLAGKLTPVQLQALEYFIKVRYKVA
jgi:hypothetical protein